MTEPRIAQTKMSPENRTTPQQNKIQNLKQKTKKNTQKPTYPLMQSVIFLFRTSGEVYERPTAVKSCFHVHYIRALWRKL